jgi:hypothetical protein
MRLCISSYMRSRQTVILCLALLWWCLVFVVASANWLVHRIESGIGADSTLQTHSTPSALSTLLNATSEECLGHLPIDVGASSLFVVEGIEDAKRLWTNFESVPSCRT